jgi:Carboxylesterase family
MQMSGPGPDPVTRMRAAYPDAGPEELLVLVHSDRTFRMPSLQLATAHAAGGGRSYLYELTWPAPAFGGAWGACHGLDVPLVFGTLDRDLAAQLIGTTTPPEAREVSAQMQTAWTDFARDGQPGWPAYATSTAGPASSTPPTAASSPTPKTPHAGCGPTPPRLYSTCRADVGPSTRAGRPPPPPKSLRRTAGDGQVICPYRHRRD